MSGKPSWTSGCEGSGNHGTHKQSGNHGGPGNHGTHKQSGDHGGPSNHGAQKQSGNHGGGGSGNHRGGYSAGVPTKSGNENKRFPEYEEDRKWNVDVTEYPDGKKTTHIGKEEDKKWM